MKRNNTPQEILSFLKDAQTIDILVHKKPDGDTLGSAYAMHDLLVQLGLDPRVVSLDEVPESLKFHFEGLLSAPERTPQSYVILDTSDEKRVDDRRIAGIPSLVIDHHRTNGYFGDLNFVFQDASSTSEIIYLLAKALDMKFCRKALEALYIGIATDTNRFYYDSTTAETLRIIADLKDAGLDLATLNFRLFGENPYEKVLLHANALTHAQRQDSLIHVTINESTQDNFGSHDTDNLVESMRDLKGIEVAALFYEYEGRWKVSLRSKSLVDVSEIALAFGGGGHLRAAGISLDGDLEPKKTAILEMLRTKLI